jgi:hypothetical protein
MRAITGPLCLLLVITHGTEAFTAGRASGGHLRTSLACFKPVRFEAAARLLADDADAAKKAKEEDDALAAAFNARLEKEGGATQFKIKTSITGAADALKDGAGEIGNAAKNIPLPSSDGIQNASPVQLIGGMFALVVLFTVVSAGMNSTPADKFTSDGTTLEFGKRSEQREVPLNAYRPEYGRQ